MGNRRQPSEHFLRRLKSNGKPVPSTEAESNSPRYERWGRYAFRFLEVLGLLFLIPTAYVLIIDLEDRKEQRVVQAWQLVTQPAPGNSGKGPALEYLNSQGIPLVGIDLSEESNQGPSFLARVDLSGALLANANLSRAGLWQADLSGALLKNADLSGAMLRGTKNLSQKILDGACGDEETQLPEGFTIKPCPDK